MSVNRSRKSRACRMSDGQFSFAGVDGANVCCAARVALCSDNPFVTATGGLYYYYFAKCCLHAQVLARMRSDGVRPRISVRTRG